jgi:hypothetical protein
LKAASNIANWQIGLLIVAWYLLILSSPMVLQAWKPSLFDNPLTIHAIYGCMLAVAFGICHVVNTHVYRVHDVRVSELVQERKDRFRKCYAMDIGYSPKKGYFRTWQDMSHVWLARFPPEEVMECSATAARALDEETPASLPPAHGYTPPGMAANSCNDDSIDYPPIFIIRQVPGDLSSSVPGDLFILEDFDPTMIYDQETWCLIQETHKKLAASRAMGYVALGLLLPFLVYSICFGFIWDHWGFWKTFAVQAGYGAILRLAFHYLDLWKVQNVYEKVPLEVNQALKQKNGKDALLYSLRFETSPLPDRSVASSRRYELVRDDSMGIQA